MTLKEVEYVAQAFHDAETYDDWAAAPRDIQQQFKDLARLAIAALSPHTGGDLSVQALEEHDLIVGSP